MNKFYAELTIIFILLLLNYFNCKAQEISDSLFDIISKNEDVIILDEVTSVNFTGKKIDFMYVNISKDITYLINSRNGIEHFKRISIPELFDPTFIQHSSTARKVKRLYDKVIIDSVQTSVKTPEKPEEINNYNLIKSGNICIKDDDKYGNVTGHSVEIKNIEEGSIVNIKYKLHFPFDENWKQLLSTRVFFHSEYPKIKYELNWYYPIKLEVDTCFYKSAPQTDTVNNMVKLKWTFRNLPGCLLENGSHPYIDLPWFIFSSKPNAFLYYYYKTNEVDFAPLWYLLSLRKVYKFLNAKSDVEIGLKTSNQLAFNSLSEKFIESGLRDTTGFYIINNFQKWMMNEIKFNNDEVYYKGLEKESMDKSGLDLKNSELKDHCRYDAYAHMISTLGFDYYIAYPVDKRYGEISNHYFTTIHDCDMLIVSVLKNKVFSFLYPVSDISHYCFEELPFYFENIKAQIIPASYYGGYKEDINKKYMTINTPSSNINDNKRRTGTVANVKIDENNIDFITRVDLFGQFSTLTRNIYLNLPTDSTINPLYLEKAYDICNNVSVNKEILNQVSYEYPYNSVVNLEYSTKNCLVKNENSISININSWLKHVYYPAFVEKYRFTDFYSDFLSTDTYTYLIKFDKPVELISNDLNLETHNDFGDYYFKTEQIDEYQIKVTSFFSVKSQKVNAENIGQVISIYRNIENDKYINIRLK